MLPRQSRIRSILNTMPLTIALTGVGAAVIPESGTWIPERRAAHWVVARWEQVGTQWHYTAGHWER